MDIKPTRQNLDNNVTQSLIQKEQSRVDPNSGNNNATTSTDTVTVTDTATRIRELEASLSSLPDVDNARVQTIREAISEGRYQVDAERIADNLLKLEQDLL